LGEIIGEIVSIIIEENSVESLGAMMTSLAKKVLNLM
jgi:hypothetical protein